MQYRLGKLAPVHDPRTLKLGAYLLPQIPDPPAELDLAPNVPNFPMFANDRFSDCTCAAAGHLVELWSALTGKETSVTDADVLGLYNLVNGGQDNGAVELNVLKTWRKAGLAGEKPFGFAAVDPSLYRNVKLGVQLFGGLYIGIALPQSAQDQIGKTWEVVNGVGSTAGSWGGHAVNCVAYDDQGLTCVTWGALQRMTWDFWRSYVDEAWVILPSEWEGVKTVLNWDDLQRDLSTLGDSQ